MTLKLVGYGIIVDDIVFPDGTTQMGLLGGAGPQTVWGAAAALGDGAQTGLASGVGKDIDTIDLAPLLNANINIDGLRRTEFPTVRSWQTLEWDGLRRHVYRVPEDIISKQLERGYDILPESYRNATYYHWGVDPTNTTLDQNWIHDIKAHGGAVSLEPYVPTPEPMSAEDIDTLVSPLLMFSANELEAHGITGETDTNAIIRVFRATDCQYLALRRGALGALVADLHSGEVVEVPAVPTDIADVVGAGNAFNGALLATLEQGIAEAACYASAAASFMIEQVGMPYHLPNRDEFMRRVEFARAGRTITHHD